MRIHDLRIRGAAVVAAFLILLAFPLTAHAVGTETPQAAVPAEDSTAEGAGAATQPSATDATDAADTAAASDGASEPSAEAEAPVQDAEEAPTGSAVSSQANVDTRLAIEALLKTRKAEFDATAAKLQQSVNQLASIIRKLDDAGVSTSVARRRLAEARTALARARASEKVAIARYRSVLGAENEGDAYAAARTAGRASSAQLERARVKVLTATRTLRAIVKNATVQNVGASTDST